MNEWANGFEHFSRDEDSFSARSFRGGALGHAQHDFLGHGDAEVVLHEFGVAQAGEWPDAGDDGDAEALNALQECFKEREIEDGLGDGVLCACFNFPGEAADFVLDVGDAGVGGDADSEVGGCANRIRTDVEAVIEAVHDVDQADGVNVKDSGGIRIISKLGRIAGEAENVAQTD